MKPRSSIVYHMVLAVGTLLCTLAQPALSLTGMPASASIEVAGVETVMTMRVDGELLVEEDGSVSSARLITPNLPPGIVQMAEQSLAGFNFYPVMVDGQPRRLRTFVRMTFNARTQADGGREIRLENSYFHGGKFDDSGAPRKDDRAALNPDGEENRWRVLRRTSMPGYPESLVRAKVEAAVLVSVLLRPDGTVEDLAAVQSSLFNVYGRENTLDKARAMLERESLRALRTWRFAPPENLGDSPDVGRRAGHVLVTFLLGEEQTRTQIQESGRWRTESRSARRLPSWEVMSEGRQSVGISDVALNEGGLLSTNSPIKLKTGMP